MNVQTQEPAVAIVPPAQIDARHLISNGQTCQIALDGQIYVLRITRAGKLILTK